jgi:hypothetical protein
MGCESRTYGCVIKVKPTVATACCEPFTIWTERDFIYRLPVMRKHQRRAVASNDALHIVSIEMESNLERYARSDKFMAVSQLYRAPAYSCDPTAVTLEHCHLATNGYLIGVR